MLCSESFLIECNVTSVIPIKISLINKNGGLKLLQNDMGNLACLYWQKYCCIIFTRSKHKTFSNVFLFTRKKKLKSWFLVATG